MLPALPQNSSHEIPQHLEAAVSDEKLAPSETVEISVTSRRPENPDEPQDLVDLRKRVLKAIWKSGLTVAPDKAGAELSLELIVERNVRYGMFHYQNAPYVYLTLRKNSDGRLVYCAYERAGHFNSASQRLLVRFEKNIQTVSARPSGSLQACAEQAMRPR